MEIAAGGKITFADHFIVMNAFFRCRLFRENSVNMVMLINLLFYLTLENGSMECHACKGGVGNLPPPGEAEPREGELRSWREA